MKNRSFKSFVVVIILLFFTSNLFSKDEQIKINESLVVTASRIPYELNDTGRYIVIISRKDIDKSPANSITDLLKYVGGIDLRRRGISDIQADVSLRGAGFKEILIMIDGVKFNNPQTGHHNLDFPIKLNDVERIEILKGNGSSSFGANAVGGIINIITKTVKKDELKTTAEYGSFNTKSYGASLSFLIKKFRNFFSFQKSISAGYREGTEFNKLKIFGKTNFSGNNFDISVSAGYSDKKFGAYSFYTKKFPNQWENTKGGFINGSLNFRAENLKLKMKFYHIEHHDDFILDRFNPEWYRNKHKTDVNGIESQISFNTKFGITVIGGNFEKDHIKSNSLGNHQRETASLFLEQRKDLTGKLYIDTALYLYHYSGWGWEPIPSVTLNYRLNNSTDLFLNIGKSFRIPTYTELYYLSPANSGNPSLQPEKSTEFETGLKFSKKSCKINISVFKRYSEDLIDWVRDKPEGLWHAENIAKTDTKGAEFTVFLNLKARFLSNIRMNYIYLKSDFNTEGKETKYILDNLNTQFLLRIENNFFINIKQRWELRYNRRLSGYEYTVIDTSLYKKLSKKAEIYIKANNITNKTYVEVGGIPMPGLWFVAGVEVGLY